MEDIEPENSAGRSGLRSRKAISKYVPKIVPKKVSPNLKKTFVEYCESSTIQGLSYLVKESSLFEK